MVKVKICGLRRMEDIEYVNRILPDYVGFVFASSKRRVDVNYAKQLIKGLDKNIKTVGVFVNEAVDVVKRSAETLNLDVLQFHGQETPEYIENFKGFTVWKGVGINGTKDLYRLNSYDVDALLLDNGPGGTGKSFNWDILSGLKLEKPIILAGGLNPSNVMMALNKVKPYAVDVSSGVETDGFKDFSKIKEFIGKVRGLI